MMEALAVDMGQNKIKALLEQRGMSVYRLQKKTGLSYQTLHALVNAEEIPEGTAYGTLKRVAEALEVTVSDLEANE